MHDQHLTIGELAKRVGLNTSALRYYEKQKLLKPIHRTESGYRHYAEEAEETIKFIQRAQQLGFSLSDIRSLLDGIEQNQLNDQELMQIAESRFFAIERDLTHLLVLRHEMRHFLADLYADKLDSTNMNRIFERICSDPSEPLTPASILDWLIERTGCSLSDGVSDDVLNPLRGQHVHIWQNGDVYHILLPTAEPEVWKALSHLAELESECEVHSAPDLADHEEGFLFSVSGENAFVFAQLFMALE